MEEESSSAGNSLAKERLSYPVAIQDGNRFAYGPMQRAPAIDPEDQRWFDLSRRGGESFEFDQKDPLRALDAYGFYLTRIEDAALRDRLRFRMARVARKAGREDLAQSLWRELAVSTSGARAGRLPISLAASLELPTEAALDSSTASTAIHTLRVQQLERFAPEVDTPTLRHLVFRIAPDDSFWQRVIAERTALETGARRHAETLASQWTALGETHVFHTQPTENDQSRISAEPIALAQFDSSEYPTRLLRSDDLADSKSGEAEPIVRLPVRVSDGILPIAWVEVRDPGRGAKVALLDQRKLVQQGLVVFLLLLGGGATSAGWIALDRQRRLAELKVRLLANVSHELKTPITSIRIFSELLAEEDLSADKVQQFGKLLTAESQRLTQRIEDLLDYAQSERVARPASTESVDPCGLLRPLADSFEYRARENNVAFAASFPNGTSLEPRRVESNPNSIERIVLNLLDNALKYRREESPLIDLRVEQSDRAWIIRVSDNGIGIRPRDQRRIFDEFYRADFQEYGIQGTGLGLAIARSLATRMGGELSVKSEPGAGSTFTLELPFDASPSPSVDPAIDPPSPKPKDNSIL